MLRYQVLGPPVAGRHAFAPLPASTMQAVSGGSSVVYGAPGTTPVWAPIPDVPVGAGRQHMDSRTAPMTIWPSIYVARMEHDFSPWRLGGGRLRGNPLPVPAQALTRIAAPAQRAARTPSRAGITATPRPIQRWKIFGGGRTS